MVYRDWLCSLSPQVSTYVQELCHKRRAEMNPQMIALYDLAQEMGLADFVAALELAAEQQMYGAEYIRAIFTLPPPPVQPHSVVDNSDISEIFSSIVTLPAFSHRSSLEKAELQ